MKPERGEFRAVHQALIDSPEWEELSPEARLTLFVVKLRLGSLGIRVLYTDAVAHGTGHDADAVAATLDELRRGNWLTWERNVYWLRNGLRFEPSLSLSNENHRLSISRQLLSLPKLPIVNAFAAYYGLATPFPDVPTPQATGRQWHPLSHGGSHTPSHTPSHPPSHTPSHTPSHAGVENTPAESHSEGPGSHGGSHPPSHTPSHGGSQKQKQRQKTEETDKPSTVEKTSSQPASQPREGGQAGVPGPKAIATMMGDAQAYAEKHLDKPHLRKRFLGTAEMIAHGEDLTAWQDGTGTPAPLEDRPRLFRMAIKRLISGEAENFRGSLRYVVAQQLDPDRQRTSSNGGAYRSREQPAQVAPDPHELERVRKEKQKRDEEYRARIDEWRADLREQINAEPDDVQEKVTKAAMKRLARSADALRKAGANVWERTLRETEVQVYAEHVGKPQPEPVTG
jgi:hypothetical protein